MHNLSWRIYILQLILILSSVIALHAQRHSKCGPNPVPLSIICSDACLVCDLNGIIAKTTNTFQGQSPPGFCTMIVHSMQWLAFIAGSTNLSFNVSVSNCSQSGGVEMGVYASDDCQTFKLVSNCNTNMYDNQTWPFTTTEPLKVGCVYYLVFDGNGPNSCDILFTVTSGSAAAPIPNTNAKIIGKTLVCKGETVNYSIATIVGACSYEWRVENGTINSSKDNKAVVTWDQPGKGKICVKGMNDCFTGNEVCLDVEIGDDTPLTELGPYYVCYGEFYRYNSVQLPAGTWNYFFKNRFGCDSNISVVVEEFQAIESNIDTAVCFPDTFKIGNNKFDSTGIYKIVFKSKLSPFCDSVLNIILNYSKLISIPLKSNDLSCQDTFAMLYADSSIIPKTGKVRYLWSTKKNDTLGLTKNLLVTQPGDYFLTIVNESDSLHACMSTNSIKVNGSRNSPQLVLLDSLKYCQGDTIYFNKIQFQDLNNSNARISIHSKLPCNALNEISSPYIVIKQDSVFFLQATNGTCQDVLPLPFKVAPKDKAIFDDLEICFDDEIDLGKLPFTKFGIYSGSPEFYFCASTDSNCSIKSKLLKLQSDTIVYAYPKSANCPEFTKFRIKVNPLPSATFTLNKMYYCVDDRFDMILPVRDLFTFFFVQFDGHEMLLDHQAAIFGSLIRIIFNTPKQTVDTGKHTVCLRSERFNCTNTICQDIYIYYPPSIPSINCDPTDSTILFNWSFHTSELYTIEVIQGGAYNRISDTSVLFTNLNRGETIKIKVSASNLYCSDVISEIECQSKTCPPVQLDILPLDTICIDGSTIPILLSAITNPNQNNGIWSWRGVGIIDSLNGLFDPKMAGPGNHKIFASLDQNGCKYFGSTTLVVRENPFADFSLDSLVCQDSIIYISFKGNKADSATFNWNLDGGIFKFINPDRELEIKWQKPGKKFLKLKLNNFKCINESSKEIEVLEPLPKPTITCESTDSIITFKWNKIKRVKNYKIKILKGNSGQLLNDTTYFIQKRFFNDSATIQLSLEDEGPCSEVASDIQNCKSPDCPPLNLLLDTILNYCITNPQIIQLNKFIQKTLAQYSWIGTSIQANNVNTGNLKTGQYNYFISGDEFGCIYKDTLVLNIYPSPEILTLDVQKIPCDPLNKTGSIRFENVLSPNPPLNYSLDGNLFQSNPGFQNLHGGSYLLFVKDANGCISDTVIELKEPETPSIDLGPDLEILKGTRVDLSALILGSYKFINWNSPQKLSCADCLNPNIVPEQTLQIICLIQNEDGCTALDSITIKVFENKIFAPNTFSPNGDNINDVFTFFGSAKMIRSLEIYDRWGTKVFSKQNFLPNQSEGGWNGRFNDQPCLPGVYVYYGIVSFEKGEDMVLKGDVTLIR